MRRTAGLVLVGVALTVLTACGSGSSSGKPAAASTGGTNAALEAYTTCLSQNGVKLPLKSAPGVYTNEPSAFSATEP